MVKFNWLLCLSSYKSFINILLTGVVIVCILLLVIEISSNTIAELQSNGVDRYFVINSEGAADHLKTTPISTRAHNPGTPTVAPGVIDPYFDTGE